MQSPSLREMNVEFSPAREKARLTRLIVPRLQEPRP